MVINLPIKALSVNQVWQGRRFKTKAYKDFEQDCYKLIDYKVRVGAMRVNGEVEIHYKFHLKNYKMTDVDNLIKPIQDVLVKCNFIEDDRKIMRIIAEKFKGADKIEIRILPFKI